MAQLTQTIRTIDLSKRYGYTSTSDMAIDKLNIEVLQGEIFYVLGLMGLLSGVFLLSMWIFFRRDIPTHGSLHINIRQVSVGSWRI